MLLSMLKGLGLGKAGDASEAKCGDNDAVQAIGHRIAPAAAAASCGAVSSASAAATSVEENKAATEAAAAADNRVLMQIPDLPGTQRAGRLILLVDASGSMRDCWAAVAEASNALVAHVSVAKAHVITFSDSAVDVPSCHLQPVIDAHGAGGTNIYSGLQLLMQKLALISEPCTVIFISDGGDTCDAAALPDKIRNLPQPKTHVNWVCWGIGAGFPTALSVAIRERLHNGNLAVKPLVLSLEQHNGYALRQVSSPSDIRDEMMAHMQQFLPWLQFNMLDLLPAGDAAPWEHGQSIKQAAPGSWVLMPGSIVSAGAADVGAAATGPGAAAACLLQGHRLHVSVRDITTEQALEVGRQWMSKLQLESADRSKLPALVQEHATVCLAWLQSMQAQTDVASKRAMLAGHAPSVLSRLRKKLVGESFSLQTVIRVVGDIKRGDLLSKLSDAEAAQRLRIGTLEGKYHDKAVRLRGLESADFTAMKQHFLDALTAHPLPADFESSQIASVISIENTADVFRQDDLKTAIQECPNAYEFVEAFPLIGIGLKVKRTDGTLINPYLIEVQGVARINTVVDSQSLVAAGNKLKLSVGSDGDEEYVNCILPLFGAKDEPMGPLLRTKLYQLAVHYQTVNSVDTSDSSSYLALLAATASYLMEQVPPSEWRQDMLRQVVETTQLVYGRWPTWAKYVQQVAQLNPCALVTDSPENNGIKCESLSKVVLAMLCAQSQIKQHLLGPAHSGASAAAAPAEPVAAPTTSSSAADASTAAVSGVGGAAAPAAKDLIRRWKVLALTEAISRFLPGSASVSDYYTVAENKEWPMAADVQSVRQQARDSLGKDWLKDYYTVTALNDQWQAGIAKAGAHSPAGHDLKEDAIPQGLLRRWRAICELVDQAAAPAAPADAAAQGHTVELALCLAIKVRNSFERNVKLGQTPSMDWWADASKQVVLDLAHHHVNRVRTEAAAGWPDIVAKYRALFNVAHKLPMPLTKAQLRQQCQQLGIERSGLRLTRSGLLSTACSCTDCPHYLQVVEATVLYNHLEGGWGRAPVPAFHVTVFQEPAASTKRLLDSVRDGRYVSDVSYYQKKRASIEAMDKSVKEHEQLAHELKLVYGQWSKREREEVTQEAQANAQEMRERRQGKNS